MSLLSNYRSQKTVFLLVEEMSLAFFFHIQISSTNIMKFQHISYLILKMSEIDTFYDEILTELFYYT